MSENNVPSPPYFYFKTEYGAILKCLTDEQAGKLIKLLCNYVSGSGEFPNSFDDKVLEMAAIPIKQDIDKALHKYRVACENGKKGGAPKGNKNAVKKGNTKEAAGRDTTDIFSAVKINQKSAEVSFCIEVLFSEAKETDFNISQSFSMAQLAQLAACYAIVNIEGFKEYCFEYGSLKSFTMNTSAAAVCKEVKENTLHWYENDGFSDFEEKFADYKQYALDLLKFSPEQIKKFADISDMYINPDTYSLQDIQELRNYITAEEFEKVRQEYDTT